MLRGIFLGIMMLLALSACAGEASPSPTASPSPSSTALPTRTERPTLDYAQLTAYMTYRPTLPATFTPTYTPSATGIPSRTPLPSLTPTPEPISELALCPGFDDSPFAPQGIQIGVTFHIPHDMTIAFEIIRADTMETFDDAVIPDREQVTLLFDPGTMPAGDYIWKASLQDATRTGLCAKEGSHTIVAPPSTNTPEATLGLSEDTTASPNATATRRPREGRATEETGN